MMKFSKSIIILFAVSIFSCDNKSSSNESEEEASSNDTLSSEETTAATSDAEPIDYEKFLKDFSEFDQYTADEQPKDFSGKYFIAYSAGNSFSLDLVQNGALVTGSYCGLSQSRVDCGMENQGSPDCPVKGKVVGDTLHLSFISCYSQAKGKAKAYKKGFDLYWKTTDFPDNSYTAAPSGDILKNRLSTAYLLVAGGGKTEKAGKEALQKCKNTFSSGKVIGNKPFLIKSDTVNGLNPGFYIAAIGISTTKELADLTVNYANEQTAGVYAKEVLLRPEIASDHIISLKANTAPFSGKTVRLDNGSAVVKIKSPAFTKYKGSFKVHNYLAWIEKTGEITYLSDLDFTTVFASNKDTTKSCTVKTKTFESTDEYMKMFNGKKEKHITCIFPNGVVSTEDTYVTGYSKSEKYPKNTFNYDEVLFYYLNNGYFSEFLENDYSLGSYEEDGISYEMSENFIEIAEEPGYSESLSIKGDTIVYSTYSGH
ncbi:hypothetical protein GCM10027429_03240 [Marivirga atlantica]|jgi:hypothetical protein|uniref:Lipoprotein n=1 Tax=Marivirga atlantica TaxID=1548457 RepID=A0A937AC58_9BACT|nr:hypothetical protein [Marivirga atlantica]MBL0763936.1 hypothetical protein [Marivirga atlantica]